MIVKTSLALAAVGALERVGYATFRGAKERGQKRSHVSKQESRLKRRRKRAARKAARMKHKAAGAKKRMQELTFSTFYVHTAAFKGVNGIGLCRKGL